MQPGVLEAADDLTAGSSLASADLVLDVLELLSRSARPRPMSDISRELGVSKSRCHRHLRILVERGYARQDAETQRYEVGVKLMALGEAVRDRFNVLTAIRPQMWELREATGQAVTASSLVDGAVTILEMLSGKTLIEFGIRPGAVLDLQTSAHGLVALAFAPQTILPRGSAAGCRSEFAARLADVRRQGWASAADQVMVGVNALAAPVFDHAGSWRGTIAIVGSSQLILPTPAPDQVKDVLGAAQRASRQLGWKM